VINADAVNRRRVEAHISDRHLGSPVEAAIAEDIRQLPRAKTALQRTVLKHASADLTTTVSTRPRKFPMKAGSPETLYL
jgi:hypothetical protein